MLTTGNVVHDMFIGFGAFWIAIVLIVTLWGRLQRRHRRLRNRERRRSARAQR